MFDKFLAWASKTTPSVLDRARSTARDADTNDYDWVMDDSNWEVICPVENDYDWVMDDSNWQ
jgi:hypothetical protein